MKLVSFIIGGLLVVTTAFAQSSTLPVVSVFPFNGASNYAPRITNAVNAGLALSKRVRIVDRTSLTKTMKELQLTSTESFKDNTVIVRAGQQTGAQYVLEGNLTAVNFDNKQNKSKPDSKGSCTIEAQLKLTDIETGISDIVTLNGSSESTGANRPINESLVRSTLKAQSGSASNETLLRSALNDIEAQVRTFARKKFPVMMQILEITEQNDKKGIISFRVEGEGLTSKQVDGGASLSDFFGSNTKVSIVYPREVTRMDGTGTKRWVKEEVARAKITKVEDGDTALCTVTDNGKKLQELVNQKARLILKTMN